MPSPKAIASASSSPVAAGAFTDALNNPIANGYLILKLSVPVGELTGGGEVTQLPVIKITLDSSGKPSAGQTMWMSDQFASPTNPPYRITVHNSNDAVVADLGLCVLSGSAPVDLTTLTATTSGASFAAPVLLNPGGDQHITTTNNLTVPKLNGDIIYDGTQFTSLASAIAAVPSGGTLIIPANTSITASSSIAVSNNIYIRGENRATSIITGPSAAALFTLSGTIRQFKIEGLTLIGGSGASSLFNFTGVTASEGRLSVENNIISTFGSTPVTFGTSNYFINIERNTFVNCTGGISVADSSDTWIRDNFFENNAGSTATIKLVGPNVHVVGNTFVRGSGNTTAPDILLNPFDTTAGTGAYIWIEDNKFGNEATEINTRYKIQVNNATTTFVQGPVIVRGNHFFGVSGQTCIRLDNQVKQWLIEGNYFGSFGASGKIIDDAYTVQNGAYGQSIFTRTNRISASDTPTLFSNGGRGFWAIDNPQTVSDLDLVPETHETPELRNRIAHSESQDSWVASGVTVTTGQTDPYGTTRACLLTRANAATFENISIGIDTTSAINRFVVKFWAKAGTATIVTSGVRDNTTSAFQQFPTFAISSTWKLYKFVVNGINTGDTFSLFFYPNGTAQTSGTMTIFGVQVSDYDSDYLPTTSAAASDTTTGFRVERTLKAANNAVIGGKITSYNAQTTARSGVPSVIAAVDLTGQTAAISATNLNTGTLAAGQYRVCWNSKITTAAGTSSTLGAFAITYTDPDGVTITNNIASQTFGGAVATTTTGNTTSTGLYGNCLVFNVKASTNIQYAMGYASNPANAMTYNLHITLEQL